MSKFKVLFTEEAVKDIAKLDAVVKKRIAKKIDYFIKLDSPLLAAEKLVSSKIGSYRWRVGDYRLIFDLDRQKIMVLRIRHRRDVYKKY